VRVLDETDDLEDLRREGALRIKALRERIELGLRGQRAVQQEVADLLEVRFCARSWML
jgi:hypothetical protein